MLTLADQAVKAIHGKESGAYLYQYLFAFLVKKNILSEGDLF
jgi:hypothetical protein